MSLAHPQLPLSLHIREDSTFANFVAGDNADLVAQVRLLVSGEQPGLVYLWGNATTGRSHVLQAACHLAGDCGRSAIYLPATELQSLGAGLLEDIDAMDLVCIDDIDLIAGDRDWEEGMFHLFNRLMASSGAMLVTGSTSPGNLGLGLPDLESRLASGVAYRMVELADEDAIVVLHKRAAHRGLEVSEETLRYLLSRSNRGVANLLAVLDQLDKSAMAAGRKLTIPLIKQVMGW